MILMVQLHSSMQGGVTNSDDSYYFYSLSNNLSLSSYDKNRFYIGFIQWLFSCSNNKEVAVIFYKTVLYFCALFCAMKIERRLIFLPTFPLLFIFFYKDTLFVLGLLILLYGFKRNHNIIQVFGICIMLLVRPLMIFIMPLIFILRKLGDGKAGIFFIGLVLIIPLLISFLPYDVSLHNERMSHRGLSGNMRINLIVGWLKTWLQYNPITSFNFILGGNGEHGFVSNIFNIQLLLSGLITTWFGFQGIFIMARKVPSVGSFWLYFVFALVVPYAISYGGAIGIRLSSAPFIVLIFYLYGKKVYI